VAQRHDSALVAATSGAEAHAIAINGAEARAAALRGRHDEEKMSFASPWTMVARDKAALGVAHGFSRKRWAPVSTVAVWRRAGTGDLALGEWCGQLHSDPGHARSGRKWLMGRLVGWAAQFLVGRPILTSITSFQFPN
jgi:hypothetical protein